jgi:hypothetical protein
MKPDMSPAAVTLRIRRVSQLRDLCLRLGKAGDEARRKGQLKPSTSRAETGPQSGGTRPDSD